MRVFVYEYGCAQSSADSLIPPSIQREGWAMLEALLEDFNSTPGVETTCLLHESFQGNPSGKKCRLMGSEEEENVFRELARQADYTVVIAPELRQILLERARWAEEHSTLLSPLPAAVRLAGDKLALCGYWQSQGIPTPDTYLVGSGIAVPSPYPVVVKPRFGAGSTATRRADDPQDFLEALGECGNELSEGDLIAQRYVDGIPASVGFLACEETALPLLAGHQHLSDDGCLHYLGGELPLPEDLARRALALGRRAIGNMRGLRGYVGVDLVLGPDPGGSGDYAIEINARLTTTYVGLRQLAEDNLAQVMLQIVQGTEVPAIRWRPGKVRFRADGSIDAPA